MNRFAVFDGEVIVGKDIVIGKVFSFGLLGIGAIVFVLASSKLIFFDAEENSVGIFKEGEVIVEEGNEGYRVYSKADCGDVDVEFYYESIFSMGDLIWDPSCSSNFINFRSSSSGDWNYLGTLTFEKSYGGYVNEVGVDFNVTSSHEVLIADRGPIEKGLTLRQLSFYTFGLGGLIFAVTRRTMLEKTTNQTIPDSVFQNHILSSNNERAIQALNSLKTYVFNNNISHTELFSAFDTNKDGQIDHFELMNGLQLLGIDDLTPSDIDGFVSLLDINGDGKINLYELGNELDDTF